jgi:integrase
MAKRTPGLYKRGNMWWIDKRIKDYGRLAESTGTGDLIEAERFLGRRLEQIREANLYGQRPPRTFMQAATKYLEENAHLRSIERSAYALDAVMPYIGGLPLRQVHMGTLQDYLHQRRREVQQGTINKELSIVRRVLNLAARVWRDEHGLTWLETAPLIEIREYEARKPYPLSWDEQRQIFSELPSHLARMCEFKVNTGCREKEVTRLRWEWEIPVGDTTVFIIPGRYVKNKRDRLVVLNAVAHRVIESVRGIHPLWVFTYKGRPMGRMNNSAWKRARTRAGLPQVRIHDLKHTFGYRLRTAGVSFEDRQDLLGHKSDHITSFYCQPDVERLVAAAESVNRSKSHKTPIRALSLVTTGAAK